MKPTQCNVKSNCRKVSDSHLSALASEAPIHWSKFAFERKPKLSAKKKGATLAIADK